MKIRQIRRKIKQNQYSWLHVQIQSSHYATSEFRIQKGFYYRIMKGMGMIVRRPEEETDYIRILTGHCGCLWRSLAMLLNFVQPGSFDFNVLTLRLSIPTPSRFHLLYIRDVREWLSTFPFLPFPSIQFPFPPIPILSMLKLYIISDTLNRKRKFRGLPNARYAQTHTRSRINYISVVGKLGTISIGIWQV